MTNSSANIARGLHVDGMQHHWTHLAAQVVNLPRGAGCVLTFLDKLPGGTSQRSVWLEPNNDKGVKTNDG